jgi:hypothetical protein
LIERFEWVGLDKIEVNPAILVVVAAIRVA